ncbi:hypothetical protein CRG93_22560 [Escherichia sp. E2593]|nr:hypothetical protein CRG92_11810 [Escherichia sp. E2586]TGC06252.1 hypothetical protein CRG93_22560 [Escherichia sp. E2593]
MPVTSTRDAERRVFEARAFGGVKPAINHKKGSIFDPDFSIILRPHVTRKFFFPETFLCAGIGYSKG